MNQLEERLRAAGRSHTDMAPDLASIRDRGRRIRRNRQIGATLTTVALIAVSGVAALNLFRPDSDTTVISASEGDGADSPERGGPRPDDEPSGTTTTTTPPEGGDAASDSAHDESVAVEVETDEQDGERSSTEATGPAMPSATSVGDGTGGWLTVTADGIEHLGADGSTSLIAFADPPGGFAQRWPTDVARIGDRHYLLVDMFVNRQDLEEEALWALAESYGIEYDPESGAIGLDEVAIPAELDSTRHFEVSILAVDLTTDEILTVERRVINGSHTPDWVYNGHITSDGSNILVMRELWQGYCLYAEGLTLDGQPVDIVDAKIYPKPEGIDLMSYDEIDAVFTSEADTPQPCRTLGELPDSGLGVWGTQADSAQMEAFRTAFFETGLG